MGHLEILLKGYTIDWDCPCHEPCPKCGRVSVYHVNEDDYKVFCTRLFCNYEDTTFNSKRDQFSKMLMRE